MNRIEGNQNTEQTQNPGKDHHSQLHSQLLKVFIQVENVSLHQLYYFIDMFIALFEIYLNQIYTFQINRTDLMEEFSDHSVRLGFITWMIEDSSHDHIHPLNIAYFLVLYAIAH